AAAGCVNWGFPTLADTDIPEILPTGICTYEHVVANVTHDEICQRSVEVRGLKVTVSEIDIPCSFGPAFEGERVRGADLHCQMGGGKTQCTELCKMAEMNEIEDGKVIIDGPNIGDVKEGDTFPMGIYIQVAGREFQTDFEPILERQIHHLINYIQGVMHIGQRDISWVRISKAAIEKGFTLKDIGVVLHAKFHQDFGKILDKVQVTLMTKKADVDKLTKRARAEYKTRDERVEKMTDEDVEIYYSCTLCQSFAPSHVCSVSPERTGLCGAYNWMDCKASFEINPTGPNQPIEKGECIDPVMGQWKGVNDFVYKASRGAVTHYNFYSMVTDPMTTCGCCECIAAMLPSCNGVMTVGRDYAGETPCGMKFTTLAGVMGGGASSPGFVGHSKFNITQGKFILGDGGLLRMVWMPKMLKEELKERIEKRGAAMGVPNLYDMIADETVGITEEEILPFLQEKGHPALTMDSIIG
ncbi:CO dehydrogenase/CO-methylating acetyl-CoA synthase complex subunit beta, partial [Desulfosarcina sp.]|uniref:CO dehydrogenase/CO-methylating acetyl-CoA synthase complex subunit beta n=1 Tax=Desulfosarcina sp. TaxID=2027861 RepID=UPI0029B89B0D